MALGYLIPASVSGYLAAGYLMVLHDAHLWTAIMALATVGSAVMLLVAVLADRE